MSLVLLVGGARSGKSRLAIDLAAKRGASVAVIATGEARDDEMAARIQRHRDERPRDWQTVEEPAELLEVLLGLPAESFVIVDCLTLWVSNLIERGVRDEDIERSAQHAADAAALRSAGVVAVTNEVGSGVVPVSPLARRFQDVLGVVNVIWASTASQSLYVVAGKVLPLEVASDIAFDD